MKAQGAGTTSQRRVKQCGGVGVVESGLSRMPGVFAVSYFDMDQWPNDLEDLGFQNKPLILGGPLMQSAKLGGGINWGGGAYP